MEKPRAANAGPKSGIGKIEGFPSISASAAPQVPALVIERIWTADIDDDQPWPPHNFVADEFWCLVRTRESRTLWRRLSLAGCRSADHHRDSDELRR